MKEEKTWKKLYVDEHIAIDRSDALQILIELVNNINRDRATINDPTQSVSVKYVTETHMNMLECIAAKIRIAIEEYENE